MRAKEKRQKMHCGPVSMLSARTNRVPTCLLTAAKLVSQRQCNTSVGRENQLSRYTPKKKSHNVFFKKTLVFSHPQQLRFGYSHRILFAMDKPSKLRGLATDTLSSKEDMEVKLNRKLPKRGRVLGSVFRPQRSKPRLLCALRRLREREQGIPGPRPYRAHNGTHGASTGGSCFRFDGVFGATSRAYRTG
jgi:hypothetical protein